MPPPAVHRPSSTITTTLPSGSVHAAARARPKSALRERTQPDLCAKMETDEVEQRAPQSGGYCTSASSYLLHLDPVLGQQRTRDEEDDHLDEAVNALNEVWAATNHDDPDEVELDFDTNLCSSLDIFEPNVDDGPLFWPLPDVTDCGGEPNPTSANPTPCGLSEERDSLEERSSPTKRCCSRDHADLSERSLSGEWSSDKPSLTGRPSSPAERSSPDPRPRLELGDPHRPSPAATHAQLEPQNDDPIMNNMADNASVVDGSAHDDDGQTLRTTPLATDGNGLQAFSALFPSDIECTEPARAQLNERAAGSSTRPARTL